MAALDGRLVVGVVPVDGQLDLKALARALGRGRGRDRRRRRRRAGDGYVAGGISPLGQRRAHPTVVDESAWQHPTVFVSAGRRGLDLEIAPADLAAITSALAGRIRRV